MEQKSNKGLGVCILTWHPPEYRQITSDERDKIDLEKRKLNNEWLKKIGVTRFGVYNPVWGTKYSTMEFWAFPDLDSIAEYRRQLSGIEGHITFFKFLVGAYAHWMR